MQHRITEPKNISFSFIEVVLMWAHILSNGDAVIIVVVVIKIIILYNERANMQIDKQPNKLSL